MAGKNDREKRRGGDGLNKLDIYSFML